MGRVRPEWVLEQGRFHGTYDPEEEVMLTLHVPLAHDTEFFRIGWDLKGLGRTGWIAISTGEAIWSRAELSDAGEHILGLLRACCDLVKGGVAADRR